MRSARSAERSRHGRRTAALSPPQAGELGSSSREQRPQGLHSWPTPPTDQRAASGSPGRQPLTPTTHGGENESCRGCRRLRSRSGADWGRQGGGRGGPGAPSLIGMTHAWGRGQGVAGRGALPARAAGTWACPVWPPPRASGSSPTSWTAAPELGPDSKKQAGLGCSQVESGPHKQESRGSARRCGPVCASAQPPGSRPCGTHASLPSDRQGPRGCYHPAATWGLPRVDLPAGRAAWPDVLTQSLHPRPPGTPTGLGLKRGRPGASGLSWPPAPAALACARSRPRQHRPSWVPCPVATLWGTCHGQCAGGDTDSPGLRMARSRCRQSVASRGMHACWEYRTQHRTPGRDSG